VLIALIVTIIGQMVPRHLVSQLRCPLPDRLVFFLPHGHDDIRSRREIDRPSRDDDLAVKVAFKANRRHPPSATLK